MAEQAYTADEMMTIAAARMVRNGAALFVGIVLMSTAGFVSSLYFDGYTLPVIIQLHEVDEVVIGMAHRGEKQALNLLRADLWDFRRGNARKRVRCGPKDLKREGEAHGKRHDDGEWQIGHGEY